MDEVTWEGAELHRPGMIRVGDAATLVRAAERQGTRRSGTVSDRIQ